MSKVTPRARAGSILQAAAKAASIVRQNPKCHLRGFLQTLESADSRELLFAIVRGDGGYTAKVLFTVMQDRGFKGSLASIHNHRQRLCVTCNDLLRTLEKPWRRSKTS